MPPRICLAVTRAKVRRSAGARAAHRPSAAPAHGTSAAGRGGGGRKNGAQPFRQLDERPRNFPGPVFAFFNAMPVFIISGHEAWCCWLGGYATSGVLLRVALLRRDVRCCCIQGIGLVCVFFVGAWLHRTLAPSRKRVLLRMNESVPLCVFPTTWARTGDVKHL